MICLYVIKRDGRKVSFEEEKIRKAITKAAASVGEVDRQKINEITKAVLQKLTKETISVEEIQDKIEETLVQFKEYKIAKAYILYRQRRTNARRLAASLGVKDDLKLPTSALIVLSKRYLLKDEKGRIKETPMKLFRRVARAIAQVDEQYGASSKDVRRLAGQFYDLMTQGYFLPNSPTLMNAGAPLGQLSACFVLPVHDSLDSIFLTLYHTAKIHQTGGGTGFNFSALRPTGDVVRTTGGVASGPVSFMRVYDAATQEIKQGGKRRGANMGILNVDHPDILEFITAKSRGGLENFNISVAVTDKFMRAVQSGETIPLVNPRNKEVVQNVPARAIWDLIVAEAWRSGDPGLLFLDTINKSNSNVVPKYGPIEATNPCLSGETWTMTSNGPRRIRDLLGKRNLELIVQNCPWLSPDGFFESGVKETVEILTKEGFSFRATLDHHVFTADFRKLQVRDLKPGDKLKISRGNGKWSGRYGFEEGYLLGLLYGDGTLTPEPALYSWTTEEGSREVRQLAFKFASKLKHRKDWKGWQKPNKASCTKMAVRGLRTLLRELGLENRKCITPQMEEASPMFYRGFLRGLFDTDGSVQGTQEKGVSIRLAQRDFAFLQAVQRMLLRLGIFSRIYKRRDKHLQKFKGKVYTCKEQFELIISNEDLLLFKEMINFTNSAKERKLRDLLVRYKRRLNKSRDTVTFIGISNPRKEPVYDIQVPGLNQLEANGIVVGNCGELPLYPYESCNLGSINLSKFVKMNKEPHIDWERLEQVVRLAVHFLDNVIDANKFPLQEIEAMTKKIRRVGLGVMGWADLLIALNIAYNSQQALDLAAEVMKFITEKARDESVRLGEQRGSFPEFKDSIWPKRGYKTLRNGTVTCIAPTGTISILAGCSPGIEPLFSIVTVRDLEESLGAKLVDINQAFESRAIKEGFYSEELMDKIARDFSIQKIPEIPEEVKRVFVTAHDISPEWHVKMQATFQMYTDNAVSKTVNLPFTATPHDVENIYFLAWKLGCKGITVFRTGSKGKQVFTTCKECEVGE